MNPFHKFKNVDKGALDKSIHAYQRAELSWNEEQALDWIQSALGEQYPEDCSLWQILKDGVVLCRFVFGISKGKETLDKGCSFSFT
jgi:hypothetical protein